MSEFQGRRGRNHHDDDDCNKDLDLSKLSFYDEDNDDEEEEPQDEEEIYNRGRSRSRSIHEMDNAPVSAEGIIAQHNSVESSNSSEMSKQKAPEKTGPLNNKEILALKKGLEEATLQAKLPGNEEEEEEERIAAENERKLRIATNNSHNASQNSTDANARRAKILMLGDSGVGKSSLIMRWTQDTFTPSLTSTVGVNFKSKKVTIKGEAVQVQVWDTAGQEQFHKITTSYYKGAQGIMLVYDVCDQKTFDNVTYWIKNIKAHASDSVQVALIANKTDLRTAEAPGVSTEKGKEIAASFGVPFFETSAKDSSNVNDGFVSLVTNIVDVMCGGSKRSISGASTGSNGGNSSPTAAASATATANAANSQTTGSSSPPGTNGAGSERRSIVEKQEKNKMFSSLRKKDKEGKNGTATGTSPTEGADKKDCIIS